MINAFDTEVAQEVGIVAAILYKNIQYWCEKNRANEMNEHDGLYWTYNSIKAYCELFPYLTAKQIRKALNELEEAGYVKSGIFNDDPRDRTKWYADASIKNNIEVPKKDSCICPTGQIDLPQRADSFAPEGEALPNNYQITTQITTKKERKKKAESTMTTFNEILDSSELITANPDLREAIIDFIKMRQRNKKPLTDRALKENINDAFRLAQGDPVKMTELFVQSIKNGWQGIWELKDPTGSAPRVQQSSDNPYDQMLKERGYT